MLIMIKGQKKAVEVKDAMARELIRRCLAYEVRQVAPEAEAKPKRQYRRRDMKAEQ